MTVLSKVIKKVSIWFKRLPFQGSLKQYYAIYLVAFAIIALVAVLSQVFIQNYLGNQSEDSYLINVAGKQRMLSQKITKNLLLFSEDKQEVIKSELSQDLEAWPEKHQLLSTNELIRTNFNTDQIDSRYKLLQPIFLKMYSNSK